MGTRGGIARLTSSGWEGVYHNWDSYPDGLGATLVELYKGHFQKDLPRMLKTLIDDHPGGWSTINDVDFSMAPGFVEYGSKDFEKRKNRPQCYCHGDRNDQNGRLDNFTAAEAGCEYVYVFDVDKYTMTIYSSYNDEGKEKMFGMFGTGNGNATWREIARIDLDGDGTELGDI